MAVPLQAIGNKAFDEVHAGAPCMPLNLCPVKLGQRLELAALLASNQSATIALLAPTQCASHLLSWSNSVNGWNVPHCWQATMRQRWTTGTNKVRFSPLVLVKLSQRLELAALLAEAAVHAIHLC
jgi:hypothetical protein